MNYFTLFEQPVALKIDKEAVRKKYFELSRKSHPDYFVNHPLSSQQDSLEFSALLNKGLKTFSNQDDTIKYVLQLKGLLEEEEKFQLSPDFLMQMMEINEELAENIQNGDHYKKNIIWQQLAELEKEIYEPVQDIIENYKDGVTTEKEILRVKDYYFRKKYLQRLYQQLEGMV